MITLPEGRFARIGGRKEVATLLGRADRSVLKLLLSEKLPGEVAEELRAKAGARSIAVETAPSDELDKIGGRIMNGGALALYTLPEALELAEIMSEAKARTRQPLLLVLDDPMAGLPELNELLKMAVLAGANGVVRRKGAGSALPAELSEYLLLGEVDDLAPLLDELRTRHKLWILGVSEAGGEPVYEMELDWAMAVVFGAPGQKLRPDLAQRCDVLARFPLARPESPASEAHRSAVLLYDLMRQRLSWATRGKVRDVLWESEDKRKKK